jgi:hypothetical protein
MIHLAMTTVREDINAFFKRRYRESKDRILLSGFSDPQGNLPADAEDNIFFLLTRISQEMNIAAGGKTERAPGLVPHVREPAFLNLHVMFAAMYRRYETGLQALSEVIAYLQGKPVYTVQNTPKMDPSLGTLAFKMVTVDYAQQSYLWGALGAKYAPSVLYSLRLLTVGEERIEAMAPAMTQPAVNRKEEAAG